MSPSVAVSAFINCRGLCACTEMLLMCVAMGSAMLFILRSILLVYSAMSGVNKVQVVLFGFSVRLSCLVQTKTLCRYGCMYFLAALVVVDVMSHA